MANRLLLSCSGVTRVGIILVPNKLALRAGETPLKDQVAAAKAAGIKLMAMGAADCNYHKSDLVIAEKPEWAYRWAEGAIRPEKKAEVEKAKRDLYCGSGSYAKLEEPHAVATMGMAICEAAGGTNFPNMKPSRYFLVDKPGVSTCPTGSLKVLEGECEQAVREAVDRSYPVQGKWNTHRKFAVVNHKKSTPPGCAVETGGTHCNGKSCNSAVFNRGPGRNKGHLTSVCKRALPESKQDHTCVGDAFTFHEGAHCALSKTLRHRYTTVSVKERGWTGDRSKCHKACVADATCVAYQFDYKWCVYGCHESCRLFHETDMTNTLPTSSGKNDRCAIRKGCAPKNKKTTVRGAIHMAGDIDGIGSPGQFVRDGTGAIAIVAGVGSNRVSSGKVRPGSIVLEFEILAGLKGEVTPGEASSRLSAFIDSGQPLAINGTVYGYEGNLSSVFVLPGTDNSTNASFYAPEEVVTPADNTVINYTTTSTTTPTPPPPPATTPAASEGGGDGDGDATSPPETPGPGATPAAGGEGQPADPDADKKKNAEIVERKKAEVDKAEKVLDAANKALAACTDDTCDKAALVKARDAAVAVYTEAQAEFQQASDVAAASDAGNGADAGGDDSLVLKYEAELEPLKAEYAAKCATAEAMSTYECIGHKITIEEKERKLAELKQKIAAEKEAAAATTTGASDQSLGSASDSDDGADGGGIAAAVIIILLLLVCAVAAFTYREEIKEKYAEHNGSNAKEAEVGLELNFDTAVSNPTYDQNFGAEAAEPADNGDLYGDDAYGSDGGGDSDGDGNGNSDGNGDGYLDVAAANTDDDESELTRKESMLIHNEAGVYDLPPTEGAMDLSAGDAGADNDVVDDGNDNDDYDNVDATAAATDGDGNTTPQEDFSGDGFVDAEAEADGNYETINDDKDSEVRKRSFGLLDSVSASIRALRAPCCGGPGAGWTGASCWCCAWGGSGCPTAVVYLVHSWGALSPFSLFLSLSLSFSLFLSLSVSLSTPPLPPPPLSCPF